MTPSLGRSTGVVAALLLAASTLTGCGLLDGSTHLEEALEYLPSDTTLVTFVDRARIADRLDLGDVRTGASDDDVSRWLDAIKGDYGTSLSPFTGVMQEAAFSDFDVEWEALGSGRSATAWVWKMSDDLDFDKVAADLVDAGYERSGPSSHPAFHADLAASDETGLIGGRYPSRLADLVLVPDEEIVISGRHADDIAKVATDDADSLADKGSYDDLLAQADHQGDLEYATLGFPTRSQGLAPNPGPDCTPGGLALFVPTDQKVRTVRLFDGSTAEKDATADADAMKSYLDDWNERYDLGIAFDVTAVGPAVLIESGFGDRGVLTRAFQRFEGPFGCPPTEAS
ncbi:hypothetical protein GCM10022237_29930 [Nocardioides ginsengisoli]|uniref:Uncharacterized protein n=1 Tax=Nocardioides ginsengisoli TaxID=363868 RepID=A0ABW3VV76_9ACTN